MDPESRMRNNSGFVKSDKGTIKDQDKIHFSFENGIKSFTIVDFNDDDRSLVFSHTKLNEEYKLLSFTIKTISLEDDYQNLKDCSLSYNELLEKALEYFYHEALILKKDEKQNGYFYQNKGLEKPIDNIPSIFMSSSLKTDQFKHMDLVDKIHYSLIQCNGTRFLNTRPFKDAENILTIDEVITPITEKEPVKVLLKN